MTRFKHIGFALGLLIAGLLTVQPQKANALTLLAAQCAVGNPTCIGVVPAVQAGGVGLLFPNRFTVTPFTFAGPFGIVTGTLVSADINAQFIYLVGFAAGGAAIPSNIDLVMSQNYVTAPGPWVFSGFDIGTCTGGAVSSALAATATNGAIGASAGLCSPIVNAIGPTVLPEGVITNMTAGVIMSFAGAGTITLPWGDDVPDPTFSNLILTQGETESQFVGDLQADTLTVELPEPATWAMMILGLGFVGGALRVARDRKSRAFTPS